jgi:hypothetical protein
MVVNSSSRYKHWRYTAKGNRGAQVGFGWKGRGLEAHADGKAAKNMVDPCPAPVGLHPIHSSIAAEYERRTTKDRSQALLLEFTAGHTVEACENTRSPNL